MQEKKERKDRPNPMSETSKRGIHIPILRILRFFLQVLFFVILNAGLFQLVSVAFPIPIIPVLSSSGAPGVTAISAFDALQHSISAVIPLLLLAAVAVFLVSALLVGKAFCGYVCPFGFAQDLVAYIRVPLKTKELAMSPKTTKTVLRIKYYILGVIVILVTVVGAATLAGNRGYALSAIGAFGDMPFSVFSPSDTLFAVIPELIILQKPLIIGWSLLLWSRMVILVISLGAVILIPRAFCRYICPIAALMGPLNKYSIVGLERNVVKCKGERCKKCEKVCPMGVPVFTGPEKRFSKHPQCILCLRCKDECREKAIRFAVP
ncbi:MAG: 4Fe-4S binding protein [Candidatus Atabeyarchaeum deiterrae]